GPALGLDRLLDSSPRRIVGGESAGREERGHGEHNIDPTHRTPPRLPPNAKAHPRRPPVRRNAVENRNAAAVGCSASLGSVTVSITAPLFFKIPGLFVAP